LKRLLPALKRHWLLALAAALAAALLGSGGAIYFAQEILSTDSGRVKADVLVVLGGGWNERSKRAAELFEEQAAPRILISGWGDCQINRRRLIEAGVPAQAIQTECESRTTWQNAEFATKLLREQKVRRVILVTTWFHSRRALACFRHYAPDLEFYSCPSYYPNHRVQWTRRGLNHDVPTEYVKILGYWLRYGVCPL
jgi:uncharacterized SAM-binding protein YcdF (DUF218 family)